jgi:hypothetical protein
MDLLNNPHFWGYLIAAIAVGGITVMQARSYQPRSHLHAVILLLLVVAMVFLLMTAVHGGNWLRVVWRFVG